MRSRDNDNKEGGTEIKSTFRIRRNTQLILLQPDLQHRLVRARHYKMVQCLTRRLRALPLDMFKFAIRRQGIILVRVRNTGCEAEPHRRAREILSHGCSRKRHRRLLSVSRRLVGWLVGRKETTDGRVAPPF